MRKLILKPLLPTSRKSAENPAGGVVETIGILLAFGFVGLRAVHPRTSVGRCGNVIPAPPTDGPT